MSHDDIYKLKARTLIDCGRYEEVEKILRELDKLQKERDASRTN